VSLGANIATLTPELRRTVDAARKAVKAAGPGAREVAYDAERPRSSRPMWKLAHYADTTGYVAGVGVYPTYAALFFYRGRELDDGGGLLQGGGKEMRFVRLKSVADARSPEVADLLRRAFSLGGAAARARTLA
jgi:hypothetical protein